MNKDIIEMFFINLAWHLIEQMFYIAMLLIIVSFATAITWHVSKYMISKATNKYRQFKNRQYTDEEIEAVDNDHCQIYDVDYHNDNTILDTKEHEDHEDHAWNFGYTEDHENSDYEDHEFTWDLTDPSLSFEDHASYCITNSNSNTITHNNNIQ